MVAPCLSCWPVGLLFERLCLLERLFDRTHQVERLLGNAVVLAFRDLLEALDGVGNRDVLAGKAGELRRDEERLRQEELNTARARDRQLVVFRQLVDAENRNDVLQVLVALQNLLHLLRDVVVIVADDARIDDARRGRERIAGRVTGPLRGTARKGSAESGAPARPPACRLPTARRCRESQ